MVIFSSGEDTGKRSTHKSSKSGCGKNGWSGGGNQRRGGGGGGGGGRGRRTSGGPG